MNCEFDVTGVTYIRNAFKGAFCLFESMASMLPFVHDMIVLDFGSTDETVDVLEDICASNARISLVRKKYKNEEASVLMEAATDCISMAACNNVLLWQADEIFHEYLLSLMEREFELGHFNLIFWRVQLKRNFQEMYWLPHVVHRVAPKRNFPFTKTSMTSDITYHGVPVCSSLKMNMLNTWKRTYGLGAKTYGIPMREMVLDTSKQGGFLDGVVGRAHLHAPMWNESPNIEGMGIDEWYAREKDLPQWNRTDTPYDIPHIMRRHLGRRKYVLDGDILRALKRDETRDLIGYESQPGPN